MWQVEDNQGNATKKMQSTNQWEVNIWRESDAERKITDVHNSRTGNQVAKPTCHF